MHWIVRTLAGITTLAGAPLPVRAGDIVVIDTTGRQIVSLTISSNAHLEPGGGFQGVFGQTGEYLLQPQDFAFHPVSGNLFALDAGGNPRVLEFDGWTGEFLRTVVPEEELTLPRALAFGPPGTSGIPVLYVAQEGGGGGVRVFNPETGAYLADLGQTFQHLSIPRDLVVDANTFELYVLDCPPGGCQVVHFDAQGNLLGPVEDQVDPEAGEISFANSLGRPAVDGEGNLLYYSHTNGFCRFDLQSGSHDYCRDTAAFGSPRGLVVWSDPKSCPEGNAITLTHLGQLSHFCETSNGLLSRGTSNPPALNRRNLIGIQLVPEAQRGFRLHLPVVPSGDGTRTRIFTQYPAPGGEGVRSAAVTVTLHQGSGPDRVSQTRHQEIVPGGTQELIFGPEGPLAAGSVVISSHRPIVATAQLTLNINGEDQKPVGLVAASPCRTLGYVQKNSSAEKSGLALQNVGAAEEVSCSITFYDPQDGRVLLEELVKVGSQEQWQGFPGQGLPEGFIGGAVVSCDGPVAAATLDQQFPGGHISVADTSCWETIP